MSGGRIVGGIQDEARTRRAINQNLSRTPVTDTVQNEVPPDAPPTPSTMQPPIPDASAASLATVTATVNQILAALRALGHIEQ